MISKITFKRVALNQAGVPNHEVSPSVIQSASERVRLTTLAPELGQVRELLPNKQRKFSFDELLLNSVGLISPCYLFTSFPRGR